MPGTVCPWDDFDSESEAEKLKEAMDGFGTNEAMILNVLGNHTCEQLQDVEKAYKVAYGKDLVEDLKSELGGNFEDLCVGLLTPFRVYDAREIHEALSGAGTDESVLVEIMCTRTNDEINEIKAHYKEEFENELEDDLQSDLSGYFRRLMVSLCAGGRESDEWFADEDKAAEDAQKFYDAGSAVWGTEEAEFNKVLCLNSPGQLLATIKKYEELTGGTTMEDAIRNECSGDLKAGYLAIVESVKSKPRYFARRLHECMKGWGTCDNDLIRIFITRGEIDMEEIRDEYFNMYETTLAEAIESECSGDYKRLLLAMLSPPN